MRSNKPSIGLTVLLAVIVLTGMRAAAQTERLLHSFYSNGIAGYKPSAALIIDAAGNLYGTTSTGGPYGGGAVFEVSPKPSGGWTTKVLHAFNFSVGDGYQPFGSLIFDAAGNLYGTTSSGGTYDGGIVFELIPSIRGAWTEKILYSFGGFATDGFNQTGPLVFDEKNNLYGTNNSGGSVNLCCGTVFQLTPQTDGSWKESIVHSFSGAVADGEFPTGGVILDAAGNLYGATFGGGDEAACKGSGVKGCGIIYKLSPNEGGTWTETVLHQFEKTDGFSPNGHLIFDKAGNLYGMTLFGGGAAGGPGLVFELTPGANGTWAETVLHHFGGNGADGNEPVGGLIFDPKGNLYGLTSSGGSTRCGCGVAFELSPDNAVWAENVLHTFQGTDGGIPYDGPVFDAKGNLYGTTFGGGASGTGDGVVFEIRSTIAFGTLPTN